MVTNLAQVEFDQNAYIHAGVQPALLFRKSGIYIAGMLGVWVRYEVVNTDRAAHAYFGGNGRVSVIAASGS